MRDTAIAASMTALLALTLSAQNPTTSFSGALLCRTTWANVKTAGGATITATVPDLFTWTHTSGTNAQQMAALSIISGTLAPGATNAVNLAAAPDSFGSPVRFAWVKFLALSSASTNTASLRLGGAASGAFASWLGGASESVTVAPGGLAMFAAPGTNSYYVGAATNLWLRNSGTTAAAYTLYIGGAP